MTGPEVASASVSVLPTFKGGSKELERVMGPALDRAGVTGGQTYGASFVSGLMSSPAVTKIVAAGGIGGMLFAGWDRLSAIDTAQAKLAAFGNDARQIESIMKSANDAVVGTQFALGEAATQAASALGSGVKQGEALTKHLTRIADVAAATSSGLGDIGMVINQITAAERLYTQDANQLVARGIPVWQLLAEQYGVTAAESRKLVEQGKVDAQTFFGALDGYIGGTAKNMDSFQANLANMRASIGRIGAGLLGGDLEGPKEAVKGLTEAMKAAEPVAAAVGNGLTGVLSVVNAIPGPVKGAALAVVALNLASRSSAFGNLRATVGGAVTSFRLLRTEAMLAGSAMPGLRVGLAGVGSAARAAGAGMLSAFGGPVGVAVAGVGLALGGLITLWQEGEQAAQNQKAAVDELTASLDANTGAVTGNTTAKIAQDLDAALVAMQELGIESRGLAQAIVTGGAPLEKIRQQLEAIKQADTMIDLQTGIETMGFGALKAERALKQIDAQVKVLSDSQAKWTRQTEATGAAAQEVERAFDSVKDAVDNAFGSLNSAAAQDSAIRNLAQSIYDNGKAIDTTTKGGIENLEALQGTIAAMADNAGDNYGVFVANVSGLMQFLDKQGVNTQNVMGAVRAAVQNVAGRRWAMYFDGSQALSESRQIIAAMRAAVAAAVSAQTMAGPAVGSALKELGQFDAAVRNAAKANSYIGSTFKGVASAGGKAAGAIKGAGKSAREVAKDLAALRKEIYTLARDWLAPSRYSSEAQSVIDQITEAYREGAIKHKSSRDALYKVVKTADLRMQRIAKDREKLAEQIDDANTALQDALETRSSFRQSIIDGFRDLADLSRFAEATEKTVTSTFREGDRLYSVSQVVKDSASAKTMVDGLRDQVREARKFKSAFDQLQKLGLNDTSLQNLMSQFLSSGDASIADGLLKGGKSAVGEVNDLMKEMAGLTGTAEKGWANELAEDLFGVGVNVAETYLKGLKSQDSALKKQYEKMADDLLTTIKKKLGIKSPSREMAKLADFTSQGWNDNLHLDAVAPGISMAGVGTSTYPGAGIADGGELWLMVDGEPIRAVVQRHAAGEARARISARRGGNR